MAKNDGAEEEHGMEMVTICKVALSPNSLLRLLTTGHHTGESFKKWHTEHQYLLLAVFMSCLSMVFIRTQGHRRQKSKA